MKHTFFLAFSLLVLFSACKKEKKEDDVVPVTNNNNGGNTNKENVAPSVTASVSNDVITVSASDVDGSISKVEILNGETLVRTLTSSPFTYSTASLDAGSYTFTVKAYDNNNSVTSTTVSFTVSKTPTNNLPILPTTVMEVISDGSAQTFTLPVSDADNNTVTITSITGASSNVTVSYSGLNITVTPSTATYAGSENLSITITDGIASTTSNFILNVGKKAQQDTYEMMKPFMNRSCQTVNIAGSVTLTEGTITTTMAQHSSGFFSTTVTAGTYTYRILNNGYVEFTVLGIKTVYSVRIFDNMLTFDSVINGIPYSIY